MPFSELISLINLTSFIYFPFFLSKVFFACSTLSEFLIIFIIASIFSTATEIPIKMCAFS